MSRKGIATIIIAIIAIVCGFMIQSPEITNEPKYPGAPTDAWCNNDYAKRIDVNVNNTGGSALADYQVYMNLSATPINETSLRVYNITSCTLRPHWSENVTSGKCTKLWINYSAIEASSWTNNTAIYYNNSSVSSTSNITTTFIFGDDFDRGDGTDMGPKWTEYGGDSDWQILSNAAYRPNITLGTRNFMLANVSGSLLSITDAVVESNLKVVQMSGTDTQIGIQTRSNTLTDSQHRGYSLLLRTSVTGLNILDISVVWKVSDTTTQALNEWWTYRLQTDGDNIRGSVWEVGDHAPANWILETTATTQASGYVGMRAYVTCTTEQYYDDFRVRKYTGIVPSTSLGSEEQQSGIVLTLTAPIEDQEFSTTTIWVNGTTNANATINFSIDAGTNETACTDCLSFSNLTSTLSEGNHNVTVYAINYTDSSDTDIEIRNFTINSLAPQWGNQTQNVSFVYHNKSINLSANGYDATGLNYAWLATNETGTWQNFTTPDTNVNDYQLLMQTNLGTELCAGTYRFTGYSEITGDYSKYLVHHTPQGTPGQVIGYRWYYPGNNTWSADNVVFDDYAVDASTLVVINATRWLYSFRRISNNAIFDIWSNDSGATWSSPVANPFNGVTTWVKYAPIDGDTSKVYVFWVPSGDATHMHQKFFYLGNETYSADLVAWTLSSNDNEISGKVVLVNNTYYVHTAANSGYAQYRTSTNLINWSSSISTGIPRQNGLGYCVDCDDYVCYANLGHTDLSTRLYSINKTLLNTTNWVYRLDLNVSNSGIPTLKIINNTHLIATNQEHTAKVQYGMLIKTHTITNSQYGSPIDLGGSTNWEWANFTWQNADYNNTKIYWKICFNDTSGLSNCTDVMSFDITEIPTTPVISNVVNGSISFTSQYVDWDVNQTAHNRVVYDNGAICAGSTSCEGQWSATHACTNASDGNWSSYAESAGALLAYAKFNYSVPAGASQSESLWHVKDEIGHANLTIPSACWGVTLYLRAMCSDIGNSVTWQCDNGPGWTTLHTAVANIAYENEMTFKYASAWDNSTAQPNITLSALTASTQYWYQAGSYNITNTSLSDNSSTLSFTTVANPPPAPPTSLTNLSYAATYIELNWDDNTEGDLQGYEVLRNNSLVVDITPPVSDWNDTGRTPSTYYCYKVRAYDVVGGRSDNSSEICVWTASLPGTNPITITTGNRALFCNWTANTTFSNIATNLTNCTDFFAYNSTTQKWTFYNTNRTINAGTFIDRHAAIFVHFNATTTVDCNVLAAETITIPTNAYYYTALRESAAKTLTGINTAITADGCIITDLYAWNSTAAAYTNTGSYSVLPNEGVAIYATTGCSWGGSV